MNNVLKACLNMRDRPGGDRQVKGHHVDNFSFRHMQRGVSPWCPKCPFVKAIKKNKHKKIIVIKHPFVKANLTISKMY